jgi:hypothetical protein
MDKLLIILMNIIKVWFLSNQLKNHDAHVEYHIMFLAASSYTWMLQDLFQYLPRYRASSLASTNLLEISVVQEC